MNKHFAWLFVLIIALATSPAAQAGFDEGLAAAQRGDYATALREWHPLAEQGFALAQYNLGVMYRDGLSVPEDKVLAYALFNLSAANKPSTDNKALSNRDRLAESLRRSELLAGQALTRELMQPGNFGKALDAWLKKPVARKSSVQNR
ncbi:SEL1-like repeat protein [Caldichromatium japonicum]|uniref:SEL1-like repeat protein n=1 Tax=Caldichromatium japonicum TaxID=2699430 RepID=UPI001B357FED|nr:SEL1-like repeat protein [Caldichromatium japonicum]